MSLNAIRVNKILAKISEITVYGLAHAIWVTYRICANASEPTNAHMLTYIYPAGLEV